MVGLWPGRRSLRRSETSCTMGRTGARMDARTPRRTLLGAAAAAAGATALGAAAVRASPVRRARAQSQAADATRHGELLRAFLAAWNARNPEGVARLFAADAAVVSADGHYAFVGAAAVEDWVRGSFQSGQALSGAVESADGERVTWRLAGTTAADAALGLPPLEFLADVRLRSGGGGGGGPAPDAGAVIAALELRGDPSSRERYSRAVATVQAGLPAPSARSAPTVRATPAGARGARPGGAPAPAAIAWFAGGAALLLAAGAAAWPRRSRP